MKVMKKGKKNIGLLTLVPVMLMLLIGCESVDETGNGDGPPSSKDEPAASEEEISSREALGREDFLQDFDYMIASMEETFPYFGVAKRRLGVDIREVGEEARGIIENYPHSMKDRAGELGLSVEDLPEMDQHIFWSLVARDFFSPFMTFAHAFPLDYNTYDLYKPSYTSPRSTYYTENNSRVYNNPVSEGFYREQEALYKDLAESDPALFQFIFHHEPPDREPEAPKPMIETEILEKNHSAYLQIRNFANFNANTMVALRSFYREIQDYDHLIIDVRGNQGGNIDFWRMFIMRALWPEEKAMPDMPLYAFYRDTRRGEELGADNMETVAQYSAYLPETEELLSATDIKEDYGLSHMNRKDLEVLGYGVRFSTAIGNIQDRHLRQFGFQEMSYPFDGQVWLLTDQHNQSAAALFARHAKEMGFATLVGEETGGAYTANPGAHVALPNSGIILRWDIDYLTDGDGRALNEYTTTPHHDKREGLDALETVLELMEESGE